MSIIAASITWLLAVLIAPPLLAMEVRVVDADGHPVLEALVVCNGKAKGAALTNDKGVATVPDTCRRIQCLRGDLLPGQAKVLDEGKAQCKVGGGAVVTAVITGEIPLERCRAGPEIGPDAGDGIYASLLDPKTLKPAGSSRAHLSPDGRSCRFQFKPVPAASYVLHVSGFENQWYCATGLGLLAEGPHTISAFWHDPAPLEVKVIGRDGKPAAHTPVHVTHEGDPVDTLRLEGGQCLPIPRMTFEQGASEPRIEETVTDEKGESHCLFDPADAAMIVEVEDPDDPDRVVSIPTRTQHRGKLVIDLRQKGTRPGPSE